jgi:hypothetical protein
MTANATERTLAFKDNQYFGLGFVSIDAKLAGTVTRNAVLCNNERNECT